MFELFAAQDPNSVLLGAVLGGAAATLLTGAVINWWLAPKLLEARQAAKSEAEITALWRNVLDSAPKALLLWPPESRPAFPSGEIATKKLGELLGIQALTRAIGFADVLNTLEGNARHELDGAVHALRNQGTPFRMNLTTARTRRIINFQGMRAFDEKNRPLIDMLWLTDRTDELGELSRAVQLAQTAQEKMLRYEQILDHLPLPVWLRDQNLRIVACNRAYKFAVEGDPTQFSDSKYEIAAGVLGNDGRQLAGRVLQSLKKGAERQHLIVQGKRRWMEIHEIPGPQGASITGCAIDITPLEEAEIERKRQEDAQGELLEALDSGVAIFGGDKRLRFFNTSFAELFKLEATYLDQKPDLGEVLETLRQRRLLPEVTNFPEYKKEWLQLFTNLLEASDELLHLPDGRTLRRLVTPHPLGGLMFLFDDVTVRFKLEESHNILVAVQRETLDNLHEAIAVFGEDGRLRLSNPIFARMWKLKDAQLQNSPHLSDVLTACQPQFKTEAFAGETRERFVRALAAREQENGRLELKDGTVLSYSIVPLPDGGSLFSFVDVSDTVNVEKALRERTQALEAADQLKSEFIANVSYGLRAPLTSIIGFTEILSNDYFGKLNAKQREYSGGILDASQRLLALINDLLDLAEIEAGYMSLHYGSFNLHTLLASSINLVRDRAEAQGLQIDFTCPADIGAITADERRLRQVVFNLLNNAVKFTPPGGKVALEAAKQKNKVMIMVRDTGSGIAPEELAKVFDKFTRGQSRQAGAGLGLALVKSLVELHGGKIDIMSKPGKGTTVTCVLPIKPDKAAKAA